MGSAADALPPIDEGSRTHIPRYEVKTSRQVVYRPATVPTGAEQQRYVKTPVSAASRPPAFNPRVSRRGLYAKEWVGDQSTVLNTISGRAQFLEERVQLVEHYADKGDLEPVAGLDNLVEMPYRAYGLQPPIRQQGASTRSIMQPYVQDQFSTPKHLYATTFSTGKLQPSRPASMASSVRPMYERMPSSPTQKQPMMSKSMLAAFGSSRGASPQLFRPVYSSWSTQPGRPHTSFEVHSDFWARSSTPGFSVPASPDVGAMRKSRRRPAAPPGRVSVSPNMSSPGEPAFVSQLVDNGVSRLDGPLRETVSQMDTAFMRIHELLRSHEATEVENAAATTIQKVFRGWVARQRYAQAIWAIRAWYREELAIPRQRMLDWTRRREAQEEFIEIVRHCQSKDLLRVAFRAWTFNLDTIRAVKKAKDERAAVFFSQMLHQRARDMLKKWLAVSLGNSSRKAFLARRKMRSQAARARLVSMAEEMGWTGNITEDMIKRELENEAVGLMTSKVRLRMFRGILAAWSKFSKFRRIAKGKHLESDRKHSQFVINKAWRSWRGAVAAKMEKWQAEGRDFNRRKLGGIARREGRVAIQRWALRYWVRRVRLTGRLSVHAKMMMSRTQAAFFRAFREQVQVQRELRAAAVEQWQVVSRDTIGYPFRCWIKLTAHMKTIKQERMKSAGAMLYRYRRRLMVRCFAALKINLQQSRLQIDLPRMNFDGIQADPRSLGASIASSKNLKGSANIADKLDAELDELIGSPKDKKNDNGKGRRDSMSGSLHSTRSRRESLYGSNKRGVLFQLDNAKTSAEQAEQAAVREENERLFGSLEKNLEQVLAAPMLDPAMEAHRLRIFLQNLGTLINDSRTSAATGQSAPSGSDSEPDVVSGAPSPKNRQQLGGNQKSNKSMRRLASSEGDGESGRKSPGSRAFANNNKPKNSKSHKSLKDKNKMLANRSMSKHQLAFFSARELDTDESSG